MMNILEFLQTNYLWIILVLLIIAVLVLLWFKERRVIFMLAKKAVMIAEEHLGTKTGQAKKAEAIAWIYIRLPLLLKIIFTEQAIDKLVEDAVKWLHKQFVESDELKNRLCSDNWLIGADLSTVEKDE